MMAIARRFEEGGQALSGNFEFGPVAGPGQGGPGANGAGS